MSGDHRVLRLISRTEQVLVFIAQMFVLLLMLVTVANIIGRFLGYPIVGAFEAGILMLVFIIYLGLAYTQSQHAHVNVDLVTRMLPPRAKETLALICLFIALAILSIMLWRTSLVAIKSVQIREFLPGLIPFPIWPGKLIVPFGLFFFIVRVIAELIQVFCRLFTFRQRESPQEVKA